jgi:hypothetical protein
MGRLSNSPLKLYEFNYRQFDRAKPVAVLPIFVKLWRLRINLSECSWA